MKHINYSNSEIKIITFISFTTVSLLSFLVYGMENKITLFQTKFEKNKNDLQKLEKYNKELKLLKNFSLDIEHLFREVNNRFLYVQTKKNFNYLEKLPIGFLTDAIPKLQKFQKKLERAASIQLGISKKEIIFINNILLPSITQLINTEHLFDSTKVKDINLFLPLSKKDLQKDFQSFDSSRQDIYGNNILQHAIIHKLPPIIIEYLLSCGQSINDTNINKENALHTAVISNNNTALQTLLSYKPEIYSDDEIKKVFPIVTDTFSSLLCSIILRNEAFKAYIALCSSGDFYAQINAQDIFGQTPLHKACIQKLLNCSKLLLNYKALPTIKDNNNKQPIDYLIDQSLTPQSLAICKELLNSYEIKSLTCIENQGILQKIDQNYEQIFQELTSPVIKKPITKKQIKNKGNSKTSQFLTNIFKALYENTLTSTLLKDNFTIINKPNDAGATPLCWSLIRNKYDYCKLLLKYNASPNNPSLINISEIDVMLTPLEHTIFIESFLESEQMLKLLLEYKADLNLGKMYPLLHCKTSIDDSDGIKLLINNNANVNLQDFIGKTALHIACQKTKPLSFLRLLSLSADPNIINLDDNKSALDYCYENRKDSFIIFLLKHGAIVFGKKIFINNSEIINFSNIQKIMKENKDSVIKISYDINKQKGIYIDFPNIKFKPEEIL